MMYTAGRPDTVSAESTFFSPARATPSEPSVPPEPAAEPSAVPTGVLFRSTGNYAIDCGFMGNCGGWCMARMQQWLSGNPVYPAKLPVRCTGIVVYWMVRIFGCRTGRLSGGTARRRDCSWLCSGRHLGRKRRAFDPAAGCFITAGDGLGGRQQHPQFRQNLAMPAQRKKSAKFKTLSAADAVGRECMRDCTGGQLVTQKVTPVFRVPMHVRRQKSCCRPVHQS